MTDRASTGGGRGLGIAAAMLVMAGLGVAAGVRWHGAIASALGLSPAPARGAPEKAAARQLWTCSMHPQVIREEPGLCPICHMQLVPLKGEPAAGAHGEHEVVIEPAVVQNMGVRTEVVRSGVVSATIRAFGTLMEREPDQLEISLRVSGWIEHLYANTDGMEIRKGEPLFDLYSPELSQAVEELIAARKESERVATAEAGVKEAADGLRESARAKLVRMGLSAAQADTLGSLDAAPRVVTFLSPRSGHVRDKAALSDGSAVQPGQRLLRILDPSVLWLDARVYERDLGRVRVGQRVEAVVDAFPGQTFPGLIAFIHPHLDDSARAGVVRINVSNEELRLREGMFAAARIQTDPGPEGPLVPREAVIDTGQRQIVFVALGEGRFEPRQVSLGEDGEDGRVRVLQGLSAGERVVVSGHFLLDSESRLREAVRKYASGDAAKSPPPQSAPQQARPSGVAPTPPAPGVPMPVAPPAASALLVSIDAVYSTYLQMAAALGKVQETDTPLDPAALVVAARAMQVAAVTPQDRALASGVLAAAQALSGQKIREQRQRFKALGGAMLALAEARPPSARVAPKLYCMHCPMAPGDWLQTTDAVANPFYPDAMKECGEVVREIPARAEGDAPR